MQHQPAPSPRETGTPQRVVNEGVERDVVADRRDEKTSAVMLGTQIVTELLAQMPAPAAPEARVIPLFGNAVMQPDGGHELDVAA